MNLLYKTEKFFVMADPRFFKKADGFTLQDICEWSNSEIVGEGDPRDVFIEDVAALDCASKKDISFFDNLKYKESFQKTNAGACFVSPQAIKFKAENNNKNDKSDKSGIFLLVNKSPYKAYALTAQKFYPASKPQEHIAASAFVHESAKIGKGCKIDHGAVIEKNVEIGDHSEIGANSFISQSVQIGQNCKIAANTTISHAIIGDFVSLYPGVRIGQDGFGFAIDPAGHVKVPQLGRVIIEDHVEIGANTCIDRGAGPDTIIGQGSWIDNLVQIGHNVKIGKGCVIVSQTGISGSTELEDFVSLGGQVGIAGHLKLGMGVQIAAKSGVMRDIPAGEVHMGYPAMPMKQFMRQVAYIKRALKNSE